MSNAWKRKRHLNKLCALILYFAMAFTQSPAYAAEAALDPNLDPKKAGEPEEVASVFRDMGVVQKRAMAKGGRFLLSTYGSLDFSDGPYTNYSLNLNPGFALSDFLELYLNVAPLFIVNARPIVETISQYQFVGGEKASISVAKPQRQFGLEVLWAPAYGKDSLGVRSIVRSDTFLKFGFSKVTFDTDDGMRFVAGVGKTYFLGKYAGLRFTVNLGYLQNVVEGVKAFRSMFLLETGLVLYL